MKLKKVFTLALVALLCVAMLAGCGSNDSGGADEGSYKDTIVYSLDASPEGMFVPVLGLSDYDSSVSDILFASMLTSNASGELEPYLAESVDISDDATTFTFKLKDAKWTDGEPITANDVAFTFTLLATPDNGSIFEEGVAKLKGIPEYQEGKADSVEGIKVIDDKTIEFTFAEPYAKGLSILGELGIMPAHKWEGIAFADIQSQPEDMVVYPVCSGPYKVEEFVKDEYVKLVANEDCFLGAPATPNFYFKVINADSIAAELKDGSVDIAAVTNLTNAEIDELDNAGFDILRFPYDLVQCLRFNLDKQYSKEFRLALAYGIDRQQMVDELMEGRGTVANVLISTGSWAYPEDAKGVERDVEQAKKYLEEAGYKDVNGDGFVEDPNGNEYALDLAYPQGLVVREKSAVVIQDNLKEIGVNVKLNMYDFPTLMEKMQSGDYDAMLMGHGVDSTDPDLSAYAPATGFGLGYSEEAQKMIADAVATSDQAERKALYKQVAEDQQANANVITLYCQEKAYAYPETMENYDAGTFNNFYKVNEWRIKQ